MQYLFFLTVRVTFLRCSDTFKNDYVQTFLARGSSFSKRQKKVGFHVYKVRGLRIGQEVSRPREGWDCSGQDSEVGIAWVVVM